MKKSLILFVTFICIFFTGCTKNNTLTDNKETGQVEVSGINTENATIEEDESNNEVTETFSESALEDITSSHVTEQQIETTESESQEQHDPIYPADLSIYNHPEQGIYYAYEYNYDTEEYDFVYTHPDVRLIWEKLTSGKMYIEYDDKHVEVPWITNLNVYTHIVRRDFTGDGVDEFILIVNDDTDIHDIFFIYDIAEGKDLSPCYGEIIDTVFAGGFKGETMDFKLYEEYAIPIVEKLKENGWSDDIFKIGEDGSLSLRKMQLYNLTMNDYADSVERECYTDKIQIRFHGLDGYWAFDYVFGEEGCYIGNMEYIEYN